MKCPKCKAPLRVIDIVRNPAEAEKYRLYKCPICGHSIFTVEYEVILNQRFEEDWVGNHKTNIHNEGETS